MISEWLEEERRKSPRVNFEIIDLTEKNAENELKGEIKKFIAHQLLLHLVDPSDLIELLSGKPISDITEYLENNVLPTTKHQIGKNTRQGDWAEIVSAEISEKLREFTLPIYKLRYKDSKDNAMRGKADFIICKLDQDDFSIIFSEVKSKITNLKPKKARELSEHACFSLEDNQIPCPGTLDFIWKKLRKMDSEFIDTEIFEQIDKAMKYPNSYSRLYHVFFVFESKFWRKECLEVINHPQLKLPNLTINIVLIDSLKELIEETYFMIPEIAMEVINNGE